jgi:ATP-binding cassette, subfamily F, member 3
MLFRFSEVDKTYAGHEILRGISFQINPGEKAGLVGRNGAGKTTIFKLLTGVEGPDSGEVIKTSNLKLGLLEQHVHFEPGATVHSFAMSAFKKLIDIEIEMRELEIKMSQVTDGLDEILERYSEIQHQFEHEGGFEATTKAETVLLGLNFFKEMWTQDVAELSGGQKNRLGLARLLLSDADVLLLDEPTNHLDIYSVEWLEEFLQTYEKAYVIVSHDRYFLDRTCTRIIEIDEGVAYMAPGNYSQYMEIREERRESQRRAYENQQAMIAKTEDFIRRNIAGQKTKMAKSRRNTLERLDRIGAVREDKSGGNFGLKAVARSGNDVLVLEELSAGYDVPLITGLDVKVHRGDSLGIIGENGSGKTTLVKTILGKLPAISGSYRWGSKTDIGYYSQQLEELHAKNEVVMELRRIASPSVTDGQLRGYLAQFLFQGDDVYKIVGDLSGGEKGRLALAKLIYARHNVLVLDEPTNHLDIPSREALEDALAEFDGTLIVISHDRFFLDKISDQILALHKGQKYDLFDGDYSEYHDWKARENKRAGSGETKESKGNVEIAVSKTTADDLSKNERLKLEKTAVDSEAEIAKLEGKLSQLSQQMSDPAVAASAEKFTQVSNQYHQTENRIAELYRQWEEALELLK